MSRIIEVLLFLTPFIAFAVWRLSIRTLSIPIPFIVGVTIAVLAMLSGLLWTRQQVASDGQQQYVPAKLENGSVVPGGPGRGR